MDSGLLWTVMGTVTGVVAVGLTAWQVRLQLVEHRLSRQFWVQSDKESSPAADGISVVLPTGRLPAEIRGLDRLLAELRQSLRPVPRATVRAAIPRVWALAGMGGLGKSTAALAVAQAARTAGWWVWWVNASDAASLTGGMLEVLRQLGASPGPVPLEHDGARCRSQSPDGRKWRRIRLA